MPRKKSYTNKKMGKISTKALTLRQVFPSKYVLTKSWHTRQYFLWFLDNIQYQVPTIIHLHKDQPSPHPLYTHITYPTFTLYVGRNLIWLHKNELFSYKGFRTPTRGGIFRCDIHKIHFKWQIEHYRYTTWK